MKSSSAETVYPREFIIPASLGRELNTGGSFRVAEGPCFTDWLQQTIDNV